MKYVKQTIDFSLQAVPISSGRLSALEHYPTHALIGELALNLYSSIIGLPFVQPSALAFTLVNVTNHKSGVSTGVCPNPPEEALSGIVGWSFTFALTSSRYFTDREVVQYAAARGPGVRLWALTHGRPQYVTVCLTPFETSTTLRLGTDNMLVAHLYMAVGMLTKAMLIQKKFDFSGKFDTLHKPLYMNILHSSTQLTPITDLITNRPYHLWVFNRNVWTSFPALLTKKHITAKAVLYFLMYMDRVPRVYVASTAHLFDAMLELLSTGARRMVEGVTELDTIDLAFAALHTDEFNLSQPYMQLTNMWNDLEGPESVSACDAYVEKLFFGDRNGL